MSYADKIHRSIERSGSCIVAGLDPVVDALPAPFRPSGLSLSGSGAELLTGAIAGYYRSALERISGAIAAVKPNLAFFEQYGAAGMRAFSEVLDAARALGLPIVADAKRGDIGSTAQAYSAAFLGRVALGAGSTEPVWDVDALTVNPFLGRDTLEPFLKDCEQYGKGVYVLVKTSNSGSGWIQGKRGGERTTTVSEDVARLLAEYAPRLAGRCGYSAVGAVVGATYPAELGELRALMPTNLFLVPGMGAQGGTAADVAAAIDKEGQGALINLSRGLFGQFDPTAVSREQVLEEIQRRVERYNAELKAARRSS